MSTPATEFLKHVLGEDGQKAFEKANSRLPTIEAALTPRTIISWLTTSVRVKYEGEIPGLENSYIAIHKSEDGYSGALTVGEHVHQFENQDMLHVAAAVALSLGLGDLQIDPAVKSTDISKLGKSIDMLVKARVVTRSVFEQLKKPLAMEKAAEIPGAAAAPKKPKEPDAPDMPVAVAPSTNKTNKPPMAKKELIVKKSDATHACPECGLRQFRNERFVGCMCFRALAKSASCRSIGDQSYLLTLNKNAWDEDTIQTFMQALRG